MKKNFFFALIILGMMISISQVDAQKISDTAIAEGIMVVPRNYDHKNQLRLFAENTEIRRKFGTDKEDFNDTVTDKRFEKVSVRLRPGKTYKVSFYRALSDEITSEEFMKFSKEKGCSDGGPQLLTLAFQLLPEKFALCDPPHSSTIILSFAKKEELWMDRRGYRRIPWIGGLSIDSTWLYKMGRFEKIWKNRPCLLCVTKQ